jgi:hypothetical protein
MNFMQDAPYLTVPVKSAQGDHSALVSPEDYDRLMGFKWRLWNGYVMATVGPHKAGESTLYHMARLVLDLEHGNELEADHINFDPLDNRRENLRAVTHAQNVRHSPSRGGTSAYRGVSWVTRDRRWQAQAGFMGKKHGLGHYADERDAARAVNAFWTARGYRAPNAIAA